MLYYSSTVSPTGQYKLCHLYRRRYVSHIRNCVTHRHTVNKQEETCPRDLWTRPQYCLFAGGFLILTCCV
jgi:hypothetical protein